MSVAEMSYIRTNRGGSRISGKGFIYITMRVFKYPMKRKLFGQNETKLVQFHGIFENGGGGGGGVYRMQVLAPRL